MSVSQRTAAPVSDEAKSVAGSAVSAEPKGPDQYCIIFSQLYSIMEGTVSNMGHNTHQASRLVRKLNESGQLTQAKRLARHLEDATLAKE